MMAAVGSDVVNFWETSLSKWIELACVMEVMTPKPGNVYPGQAYDDAGPEDFIASARIIAPILAASSRHGIGLSILSAVRQTQRECGTNTNLGIILLIAPMAAVPPERSLSVGIHDVLSGLSTEDAHHVYEAIRLADPGGLGSVEEQDVRQPPDRSLVECMKLAADRDMVARQYVNGFDDVLTICRCGLRHARAFTGDQRQQVGLVALRLLACEGDSLIARKCGSEMSELVSDKAASIVAAGWPDTPESHEMWKALDTFLRIDGNRRNPGTTADMIAAALFAALREGCLTPRGGWWKTDVKS